MYTFKKALNKAATNHLDILPGYWLPVNYGEPFKNKAFAVVRCPTCGHLASLAHGTHEVGVGGMLTPSLVCPQSKDGQPCTFHDHCQLDGWEESNGKP